jgi:hypothetical protein
MGINVDENKLVRFEIDVPVGKMDETLMNEILTDFSLFTAQIISKYEISGDRFNLEVYNNSLEKVLNL